MKINSKVWSLDLNQPILDGLLSKRYIENGEIKSFENNDVVISSFSGSKDIKNRAIYANDILLHKDGNTIGIAFDNAGFGYFFIENLNNEHLFYRCNTHGLHNTGFWKSFFYGHPNYDHLYHNGDFEDWQVIGNIFENYNLIKNENLSRFREISNSGVRKYLNSK